MEWGNLVGAPLTSGTAAAPVFLGASYGAAGGVAAGIVVEAAIRHVVEKDGSSWIRVACANGIRFLQIGAGTALTTTAIMGLIGVSADAAVSLASFGVGFAVIGVAGMVISFINYRKRRRDRQRIEDAADALLKRMNEEGSLEPSEIQAVFQSLGLERMSRREASEVLLDRLAAEEDRAEEAERIAAEVGRWQFRERRRDILHNRRHPQNSFCCIL